MGIDKVLSNNLEKTTNLYKKCHILFPIRKFILLHYKKCDAEKRTYRVFELDLPQKKHLLGHQKYTFKSQKQNLYIHEMRTFDL